MASLIILLLQLLQLVFEIDYLGLLGLPHQIKLPLHLIFLISDES